MKIIKVAQGSDQWLAARGNFLCASDAPVMMGASKHTKRSELVRMKATGDRKEFSDWVQKNLLDNGHGVEPKVRAIVEEMIGDELYPVTGTDDTGRFLASFDGINMAGDTGFECKLWNEGLAAALREGNVPPSHHWQLDHQIIVGNLKRIIFACSDGTKEKFVSVEYRPDPKRLADLQAGWKQFEEDVAGYQHVDIPPTPVGRTIPDLPALTIVLDGKVKKSNLEAFRTTSLRVIGSINTDLKTDQDFADAAEMVKFCENAEKKLELAKESALAQASSIEEVFRVLDDVRETMRSKRLELDKLVEARKKAIRAEILAEGQAAFRAHVDSLNVRLGASYIGLAHVPIDFAAAMKGKKTIESLRDAVATALAQAKIAANAIADKADVNLKTLAVAGPEYRMLFADLVNIVFKEPDDFAMLVKMRIAEHKVKEEQRINAAAAARLQPSTATVQAPAPSAKVVSLHEARRPTDEEIVSALATHYGAPHAKVVEWLLDMDLNAAAQRVA